MSAPPPWDLGIGRLVLTVPELHNSSPNSTAGVIAVLFEELLRCSVRRLL